MIKREVKTGVFRESKSTAFLLEYESMEDIRNSTKDTTRAKSAKKKAKQGDDWHVGNYGSESYKRVINGDSEFEEPSEVKFLRAQGKRMKRRKKYSDMGTEVDVMRALNGSMEPFQTKEKVSSKDRNLRIVLSFTINAFESTDKIKRFAEDCISECYKLQMSGYMVSIEVGSFSKGCTQSGKDVASLVKLKGSNEPFDYKRISTMIYPTFYRNFIIDSLSGHGEKMDWGYGSPINDKDKVKNIVKNHFSGNSIVFHFGDWKNNNEKLREYENEI